MHLIISSFMMIQIFKKNRVTIISFDNQSSFQYKTQEIIKNKLPDHLQYLEDNIYEDLPQEDKEAIKLILVNPNFQNNTTYFVQKLIDSQSENDKYCIGETGAIRYLSEQLNMKPQTNKIVESAEKFIVNEDDFPLDPSYCVLDPRWKFPR